LLTRSNSLIIVKLQGGLGNQMFQYAFGKYLEKEFKKKVFYDLTFYNQSQEKGITTRNFELGIFDLKINALPLIFSKIFDSNSINYKFTYLFSKAFRKLFYIKHIYDSDELIDIKYEAFSKQNAILFFVGYWQNFIYTESIWDDLKKDFYFASLPSKFNQDLINEIKSQNSVSIHIRRADYLENKNINFHGICSLEYYFSAIDYIKRKTSNPHFYVFSDDIEWAQTHLVNNNNITFVNHNNGLDSFEDLRLMKNCKHNIIANSSFSWWGGWLNENQNKIIIAPEKWYIDPINNEKFILPDSWVRM